MTIQEILRQATSGMQSAVEHFGQEMNKMRTGRASTSLLDDVRVDYYGTPTPLAQVAAISTPDARTIVVQPWEKPLIGEIEKSILQADLGFNPSNDGQVIRIPIPPLTDERRKEIVKMCKKSAEEFRVSVRNHRRDSMEALKKSEKEEHLSEDDRRRGEDDLQSITNKHVKQIDTMLAEKENQLMSM
jgi:ribosome recycling factor